MKPAQTPPAVDGKFDPLTYKNSYGTLNVNPNLIVDLDQNPGKTTCSRCTDAVHKWTSDLCTSYKNKAGVALEKLSYEENNRRQVARFKAGHFAQKDPTKPHRTSQSVQQAAGAAHDTAEKFQRK